MLLLYGRITNSLVEMGKIQANLTTSSITSTNASEWSVEFCFRFARLLTSFYRSFVVASNITDTEAPLDRINGILKYYVLIGFLSIIFYWIAWASWIVAAERQVRRIRFVVIRLVELNLSERSVSSYLLFRNILRQEIGWFDVHHAGELSNRLIEDLGK